jgi:hypothetical protein
MLNRKIEINSVLAVEVFTDAVTGQGGTPVIVSDDGEDRCEVWLTSNAEISKLWRTLAEFDADVDNRLEYMLQRVYDSIKNSGDPENRGKRWGMEFMALQLGIPLKIKRD